MTQEEEKFLKRLMATFKVEADEHLKTMSALLHELESAANETAQPGLIESLFREVHSLKGAARSVNLSEAENLCQILESVLAKLKQGAVTLSAPFYDVCYGVTDQIALDIEDGIAGRTSGDPGRRRQIKHELEQISAGRLVPSPPPPAARSSRPVRQAAVVEHPAPAVELGTGETVRISIAKLDALLIQAEELSAFKFSSLHVVEELREVDQLANGLIAQFEKKTAQADGRNVSENAMASRGKRTKAGRHSAHRPGLAEESQEENLSKALIDRLQQLERQADLERRQLSAQLDNLLQDMKQVLMSPFSTLLDMAPKLVRDLAQDSGKEVELVMQGTAIEIDRRILEQIKAPLVHLLRNAVDHGIEAPAARLATRKTARGKLSIEITPKDGNKIEMSVTDDGAGLNLAQIGDHALKSGIVAPDALAKLDKRQTMDLIFESGLSTSAMLTDVSGRGLGLAIVREKVEKLGGTVYVEENERGGTRFRMLLPSTLATFRGLLVAANDRQFVLPSMNVERVARIPNAGIKTVENRETIELDGVVVSLVALSDALQLGGAQAAETSLTAGFRQVAVLGAGGKRIAFAVDSVIGDQEVLVKKLGPQLLRVPNIAGVTVLERGKLVPILNVPDLLKSALKVKAPIGAVAAEMPVQSVLVVEDSITSRSLIRGILEAAGYRVSVAVDGIDGLTTLRTDRFDLVVSDVEMPRMNGFELTAKIRADGKFGELPVILVTALDTREDKERGIEVGANAYIVKSSFDQSNLLDAIRRLI